MPKKIKRSFSHCLCLTVMWSVEIGLAVVLSANGFACLYIFISLLALLGCTFFGHQSS